MEQENIIPPSERKNLELILEEHQQPLDFQKIFGNNAPVELEVGSGKGLFLMKAAQIHPDHNFIGLDYARKYLMRAKDRVEKRGLENVRIYNGEALSFMSDWVPPQSLEAIHIYFPDPWPKKRHHKRRLFNLSFIEHAHGALRPGGILYIATDHADYWEWMQEILEKQTLLLKIERLPEPPDPSIEGLTNYEIKYIKEGRPIYKVCYGKPE